MRNTLTKRLVFASLCISLYSYPSYGVLKIINMEKPLENTSEASSNKLKGNALIVKDSKGEAIPTPVNMSIFPPINSGASVRNVGQGEITKVPHSVPEKLQVTNVHDRTKRPNISSSSLELPSLEVLAIVRDSEKNEYATSTQVETGEDFKPPVFMGYQTTSRKDIGLSNTQVETLTSRNTLGSPAFKSSGSGWEDMVKVSTSNKSEPNNSVSQLKTLVNKELPSAEKNKEQPKSNEGGKYVVTSLQSFLFNGENSLPAEISVVNVTSKQQALSILREKGYTFINDSVVDEQFTGTLGDMIKRYDAHINTNAKPNEVISFKR